MLSKRSFVELSHLYISMSSSSSSWLRMDHTMTLLPLYEHTKKWCSLPCGLPFSPYISRDGKQHQFFSSQQSSCCPDNLAKWKIFQFFLPCTILTQPSGESRRGFFEFSTYKPPISKPHSLHFLGFQALEYMKEQLRHCPRPQDVQFGALP